MHPPPGYTVLIDGYNAIKRHAAWAKLPLSEGRRRLIELVQHARWPVPIASVTIVFDGHASEFPSQRTVGLLRVRFATPTADTDIMQTIRTSHSPDHLLVISNDGEILRTAKSHGVLRYAVEWLVEARVRAARPGQRIHDGHVEKPTPPAKTAREITEELAKRWLDPKR